MYQPQWIDGQNVGTSRRDGPGRYEAIASRLRPNREFTVLDLGAHAGYFSVRLAEEFGAFVTAVDDAMELHQLADSGPYPRVRTVHQRVGPNGLRNLGHYDVGLCLSVLHHVPWWPVMLRSLRAQCRVLFVETAVADEELPDAVAHTPEVGKVVADMGGEPVFRSPGFDGRFLRPLYMIGSL